MLKMPFYDPTISYEDNYELGPFGDFANDKVYKHKGKPKAVFLKQKVYLPFGIPAGPVLNSRYVKSSFEKGFDIVVYKTVRSSYYPCHPYPNVLPLQLNGDLTLKKASGKLKIKKEYGNPLSITNSFGVPSKDPYFWQADVKRSLSYAGEGQVLVLSFMGTVKKDQTEREFVSDFAHTARMSYETGAKVLEVNLSCPNVGNEGLVCYNLAVTAKILKAIRGEIGNRSLIVKVGYYKEIAVLEKMAEIVNEYADDIAGINTIPAEVINVKGEQALPGPNRLKSGVCGHAIKWAALETVSNLKEIKERRNFKFSITGVGGVTIPKDYFEFRKAGADVVMSATGAMWNPLLAQQIKAKLKKK
ncbi:MAG: hypothetical protein WBB49_03760 [Microgenomates group bacterium]